MTLAAQYAKALYLSQVPEEARVGKLREVLARRGHERLLPQIAAEYEKLLEHNQRLKAYKTITPEKEQNRILLELYRKLVSSH